jgi:hypothetical protein
VPTGQEDAHRVFECADEQDTVDNSRHVAGLSLEEAAACLSIAPATAKRRWAVARAWLYALAEGDDATPG